MQLLFLHNNLTRQKSEFQPANAERVTVYVCGPTVYGPAHIGNARPAVVF
ncbi:MAG TPA: cysteine--tRNA ligase, partial [Rhodobiaceae bacterium]|nr:cysteine--tRNA ligase [Rhodobiaceae bacterium]